MKSVLGVILVLLASPVTAWDGFDWNTGTYIEIGDGNLVRPGETIEIFDWSTGTYTDVEVESMNSYGSGVEVEVYDWDTGDYRTFDMD